MQQAVMEVWQSETNMRSQHSDGKSVEFLYN